MAKVTPSAEQAPDTVYHEVFVVLPTGRHVAPQSEDMEMRAGKDLFVGHERTIRVPPSPDVVTNRCCAGSLVG